jgi:RNA polymerase sigma factor (sigma-70 family)
MARTNPLADDAPTDAEDQALVARARSGDREALEALVGRHQPWIYNIAARMLYHAQDAEDATQEILVKALTALASFEGRSSFLTWLYRIVVNHVLNTKRGRREPQALTFGCYGHGLDTTPDLEPPDEARQADPKPPASGERPGNTGGSHRPARSGRQAAAPDRSRDREGCPPARAPRRSGGRLRSSTRGPGATPGYETRLFPELEYTFKHALTHEVTYRGMLRERRRELHARIVGAIEQLYPGRLDEHVERLADHTLHGELWPAALRYSRQSGDKAFNRSANREAVASFDQALIALDHLPESPETLAEAIDIRLLLCGALFQLAELKRLSHYLGEAEILALRLDDRQRLAWVRWQRWEDRPAVSQDPLFDRPPPPRYRRQT